MPDMTTVPFTNLHVPFPLVKGLSPSTVHIAGSVMTVTGVNFAPSLLGGTPIVTFQNFTVSDPSASLAARRRAEIGGEMQPRWSWLWNNWTQRSVPVLTDDLPTVQVGPHLNSTVCSVLAATGLAQQAAVSVTDLQAITGLLNFSWSADFRRASFITPCRLSETGQFFYSAGLWPM